MDSSLLPLASRVLTQDGKVTDELWRVLVDAADVPVSDAALMPLAAYLAQPQPDTHGVWLAPADDPADLAPYLASVPRVAVQFPRFADGRGYSIAHILRRRGYAGDLRAFGDVLVDQLFMLKRAGFTSFVLRVDQSLEAAQAALSRYSFAYQSAAEAALPAFRRRTAAARTHQGNA